jgi:hypothetical protein
MFHFTLTGNLKISGLLIINSPKAKKKPLATGSFETELRGAPTGIVAKSVKGDSRNKKNCTAGNKMQ